MKILTRIVVLSALLALAVGCGSDSSTAPNSQPMQIDAATAEQWGTSSLETLNGLAIALPDFAEGDFSTWNPGMVAKSAEEPTWDPEQMAYVYDFSGPVIELEAPSYWLASISLWVQYRDGAGPVQYPLSASEMAVSMSYGMNMHTEEQGSTADLDYEYLLDLTVSDIDSGDTFGVVGTGSAMIEVSNHTPDVQESGHFFMAWELDMTVSPNGCPAGTATLTAQQWTMAATYDGAGNVSWMLSGPGYSGNGSDVLPCQPPM